MAAVADVDAELLSKCGNPSAEPEVDERARGWRWRV
jgi:hypothetical protein